MQALHDLYRSILADGDWQDNRTGIRSIAISGAMLKFDLQNGIPAVTTKKLFTKSTQAELCGFLRGVTSAADFRALGTKIWDQNANENEQWLRNPNRRGVDDVGPIYGAQWRRWQGYRLAQPMSAQYQDAIAKGWHPSSLRDARQVLLTKSFDQLRECADKLVNTPSDRRILFSAWNPAELDQMALPPCHVLYQFNANVTRRELSMNFWMRSVDGYLGAPFNLYSAGLLLSLMARLTGFRPRWLTWFGGDVHLYENQLDAVHEQLSRTPYPLPTLRINDRVAEFHRDGYRPEWLDRVEPADFELVGYQCHPALPAAMAV